MKKIFQFILLAVFIVIPVVSSAQSTSGTCTGEIRTDLAAAQDCVNKAIAQGEALGYDMSCKVEQLGLAGFIDPTSGKDYILNGVCTVNGSTGHGAYLLAGFTAAPGSNAIIQSVNPGWSILQTELAYGSAFAQCGGKAPYFVNGSYTCSAPAGALPVAPASVGSTKNAESSATDISTRASSALLSTLTSLYANLLNTYKNTYGIDLKNLMAGGTPSSVTSPNTNPVATNSSQCYRFTQTLQNNSTGNEVFALTYALKHEGFLLQTSSVFDTTVMTAVKRFQEAHATEILNILGLTQGTGVVAEKTRAYLNSKCIVPASVVNSAPTPPSPSCPTSIRSGIRNGKYTYTFSQSANNTWTVTLNNPAYSTQSDPYYVPANFAFTATDALDLNRQNQGKFNYLQSLPGTAVGNTEYANLFGSFNNAYFDWKLLTQGNILGAMCTNGTTTPVPPTPSPVSTSVTGTASTYRYVKVSIADWDTLPLGLREITVVGANNTVIRPISISATDWDRPGYQLPTNAIDGNENTLWRATKTVSTCATPTDPTDGRGANTTSGRSCQVFGDLQVITLDLGQPIALDRVNVMNYGLTDTRVIVIEVSTDDNVYTQIAEFRAQTNAPIQDKGVVIGMMKAVSTSGPLPALLTISSLTPNLGTIDSTVTLTGTGFTSRGNKLNFGDSGSGNNPIYSLLSSDGRTLTFTVPTSNYLSCWTSTPPCAAPVTLIQPGVYNVSITNINGTSNTLPFTVSAPSFFPTQCEYPAPPPGYHYEGADPFTGCGAYLVAGDGGR